MPTIGAKLVLDVIAGITSLDERTREQWGGAAGFDFSSPHVSMDTDERQVVALPHIWAMCIEPSTTVRERLLDSIVTVAGWSTTGLPVVAEVLVWLDATGFGGDEWELVELLVETLGATVEGTEYLPEMTLSPERSAPLVDVLRRITSTVVIERRGAPGDVPALLRDLRPVEQRGLTGVLARAVIIEQDLEGLGRTAPRSQDRRRGQCAARSRSGAGLRPYGRVRVGGL